MTILKASYGEAGPPAPPAFLYLGLTKRAAKALFHAGIHDIHELTDWTERDLRSLPSLGATSVERLRQHLFARGLSFRAGDHHTC